MALHMLARGCVFGMCWAKAFLSWGSEGDFQRKGLGDLADVPHLSAATGDVLATNDPFRNSIFSIKTFSCLYTALSENLCILSFLIAKE